MWLKVLLAALTIAFCTLVGHFAAGKYRARKRFYTAMHAFNEAYLSELQYARQPLPQFLEKAKPAGEFGALVKEFSRSRKADLRFYFLTAEEKEGARQYLEMLGRGDSQAQKTYFGGQREGLAKKRAGSEKEAKERGELYLKLGLLAGLAIVILIV